MGSNLCKLNIDYLDADRKDLYKKVLNSPVKIMQIGEGNFLMSFFDWMVDKSIKSGKYEGSIALTCPLNNSYKINTLKEQDMLYTVIERGLDGDSNIFNQEIVNVFSDVFNYNLEWEKFLSIAEKESLDVIISNTTEAGLTYKNVEFDDVQKEGLYPAKLTAFLAHRFNTLGNISKKLLILPCELVSENGKVLKEYVIKHSEDFKLSKEFKTWVEENCLFLNNLVDRIVPGYPRGEENEYFERLGYVDSALSMCEPYFLWAIEGSEDLDNILPLKKSGLNVKWVESLHDIQLLKVRILNGSHTIITPQSILKGFKQVDEVIENDNMKKYLDDTLKNEILPSLKNKTEDKYNFASDVLQRFRNPYIKHKLESISMNSVSKFTNRVWPTIKTYIEDNNKLPENMMVALVGLLRFYQIDKKGDLYVGVDFYGNEYTVFDTPEVLEFMYEANKNYKDKNEDYIRHILSEAKLWGEDISSYLNIVDIVYLKMREMEAK